VIISVVVVDCSELVSSVVDVECIVLVVESVLIDDCTTLDNVDEKLVVKLVTIDVIIVDTTLVDVVVLLLNIVVDDVVVATYQLMIE
jgi:hypothetical protein